MLNDIERVRHRPAETRNGGAQDTVAEHLSRARHASNAGDVSHTLINGQEALALVLQRLAENVEAIRALLERESRSR
ncbi:MAG: hypothetical protein KJZ75_13455 [Hyphomonadaceae bacterium]|nr:hypothetical protein [Hyphomonadaceae bacterium]GIK48792.1 MAG: hypothetical protein BroJett013_14890 [Alphaproteobacteria bacterium]